MPAANWRAAIAGIPDCPASHNQQQQFRFDHQLANAVRMPLPELIALTGIACTQRNDTCGLRYVHSLNGNLASNRSTGFLWTLVTP